MSTRHSERKDSRWIWLTAVSFIALVLIDSSTALADSLDRQLGKFAVEINQALKKFSYSSATLQVTGPATFPTPGPAYIRERLAEELGKVGVTLKRSRADVGLACSLKFKESDGVLAVTFSVSFVDNNDQPVGGAQLKDVKISDPEIVARLLGSPVSKKTIMPVSQTKITGGSVDDALDVAVLEGFRRPNQQVDRQTVARAEPGSPYGIEIIAGGQAKPLTVEDGLAFVDLKTSDEFVVHLVNDSSHLVAVELRLDGIDSSWYSQKRFYWLVRPRTSVKVSGWYYGGNKYTAFQIVPVEQSVAAKLGTTGDIGVVSAVFRRAYLEGETIARDDEELVTAGSGVGEGREILVNTNEVKVSRYGRMLSQVPVRYEKPADK